MQPQNNSKLAKNLLIAAALFAILAIALGIIHSQYSDPESSTPAPYIGLLAFILAVISLIYYGRAKKQKSQINNKWAYRIVGLIILAIIVYFIIGVVSFGY